LAAEDNDGGPSRNPELDAFANGFDGVDFGFGQANDFN